MRGRTVRCFGIQAEQVFALASKGEVLTGRVRKRRVFVAITVPASACGFVSRLHGLFTGARWSKPEQFHITLRYVGDLDEETLCALESGLAAFECSRFDLRLRELGTFPPAGTRRRPRVLWIRPDESAPLFDLRRCVENAVRSTTGVSDEKPFAPHVTLARFRRPPSEAEMEMWFGAVRTIESAPFTVERFHLYDSELTPAGAVHRVLRTYELV